MSEEIFFDEIGYADWDKVCKACEKEFDLIKKTRVSMAVAEQCQKATYKLALKERAKYPEPEPEQKEVQVVPKGTPVDLTK